MVPSGRSEAKDHRYIFADLEEELLLLSEKVLSEDLLTSSLNLNLQFIESLQTYCSVCYYCVCVVCLGFFRERKRKGERRQKKKH